MKDFISRIINEEINKFIIKENLQSLAELGNQLDEMIKKVSNQPVGNLNQQAHKVLYDTEYFILQIVFAIRRCVQSNNLNESFMGINFNIPPELGGNFYSDAKNGYYNTRNATMNFFNGRQQNGQYGEINATTVKSENLSSLLQRSNQVYTNYLAMENNYPQAIAQVMRNIFSKITEINTLYNQLVQQQQQNAQGQNP